MPFCRWREMRSFISSFPLIEDVKHIHSNTTWSPPVRLIQQLQKGHPGECTEVQWESGLLYGTTVTGCCRSSARCCKHEAFCSMCHKMELWICGHFQTDQTSRDWAVWCLRKAWIDETTSLSDDFSEVIYSCATCSINWSSLGGENVLSWIPHSNHLKPQVKALWQTFTFGPTQQTCVLHMFCSKLGFGWA